MGKNRRSGAGRDGSGFVALPNIVIDSVAWQWAAHPTRSLVVEVNRQYDNTNNGKLLASRAYLLKRGWRSNDVITRATHEALMLGLLFQTVIGQLPNKAAWFAVTWQRLDKIAGYDVGVTQTFTQGAYKSFVAPAKEEKKKIPVPFNGRIDTRIAPSNGRDDQAIVPRDGVIRANFDRFARPPDGHRLDLPSTAQGISHARR